MADSDAEYLRHVRNLRRNVQSSITPDGKVVSVHSPYQLTSRPKRPRHKPVERQHKHSKQGVMEHCFQNNEDEKTSECGLMEALEPAPMSSTELSHYEHYISELRLQKTSSTLVDSKIMAVCDYNISKAELNLRRFVAVIRVSGSLHCSCSEAFQYILSGASSTSPALECIHLKYAQSMTESLDDWFFEDDHGYGRDELTENSSALTIYPVNESTVLVYDGKLKGFVTVYVLRGQLKCSCLHHRGICKYTSFIRRRLQSHDMHDERFLLFKDLLDVEPDMITIKELCAVSWTRLPLASTASSSSLVEETIKGASCLICLEKGQLEEAKNIAVRCFDVEGIHQVTVELGKCAKCGGQAAVDGYDSGVINMGSFVVTHKLLRRYLKLFLTDGLTLNSFYKNLKWHWIEMQCDSAVQLSYTELRLTWVSFVKLLDYQQYFSCPQCGPVPKTVICDGMTLGFRQCYRVGIPNDESDKDVVLQGCNYQQTMIIKSKRVRTLLKNYIAKDLNSDRLDPLLHECQLHCPMLCPVLQEYVEDLMPPHWQTFMTQISKDTPAVGLVQCSPGVLRELIEAVTQNKTVDNLIRLNQVSPSLNDFFINKTGTDMLLLKPILDRIFECLTYVWNFVPHDLPLMHRKADGFFPTLPLCHRRGRYAKDCVKSASSDRCTKIFDKHRTLMPGIFTVHCPHGICYGFQIMDQMESPNVPFTVFRTRFPVAPDVIIYDNCCNLHKYTLNRDPGFFKNSLFLIDRFHWNNHTACSSGYDLHAYPDLKTTNSQVAEQRNSALARLRASLSYQTEENFVGSLSLYLSFRNALNILKHREPSCESESIIKKLSPLFR